MVQIRHPPQSANKHMGCVFFTVHPLWHDLVHAFVLEILGSLGARRSLCSSY